jgi:hypothetical protein
MSLEASLKLMEFPFSKDCIGSKVPDGKVRYSIADHEGIAGVYEFDNRVGQVILCPNYVSPFTTMRATNGPVFVTCVPFIDPSHDIIGDIGDVVKQKDPTAPDRWRLVSAGLKVILVDNSVQNDGWFEAIRLNWSKTERSNVYFDMQDADGVDVDGRCLLGIDMSSVEAGMLALESVWCNEPSYMTGKLRDIDKYMFYLQSMEERDFVCYKTSWADDDGISPSYDSLIDKNFDNVVIRFHTGTDLPAGTAVEPTKVVINTIHHFEEIYDRGNFLAKFQTPCLNESFEVRKFDRELRSHILPGVECFPDRNISTLYLHDREEK